MIFQTFLLTLFASCFDDDEMPPWTSWPLSLLRIWPFLYCIALLSLRLAHFFASSGLVCVDSLTLVNGYLREHFHFVFVSKI